MDADLDASASLSSFAVILYVVFVVRGTLSNIFVPVCSVTATESVCPFCAMLADVGTLLSAQFTVTEVTVEPISTTDGATLKEVTSIFLYIRSSICFFNVSTSVVIVSDTPSPRDGLPVSSSPMNQLPFSPMCGVVPSAPFSPGAPVAPVSP